MNQEQAQFNMVEQQIRPWNVLDEQTLSLIRSVPRSAFVEPQYADLACADTRLPIGHGEVMMPPTIEARLLQALQPAPGEQVLEVGTGSGYLTALLAGAGAVVVSIDRQAEFIDTATARLAQHGVDNVDLRQADIYALLEEPEQRYDVIVLTGSLPLADRRFNELLTCNGRLFAVIGNEPVMQAHLITRRGENEWSDEVIFETCLPPLHGALKSDAFTF